MSEKLKNEWNRPKGTDIEHTLYWVSIVVVLLLLAAYGLTAYLSRYPMFRGITRCQLKEMFGIPCPGCGGTRAVICLLKGQIRRSLYYHAFAVYLVAGYGIFFVTQTLQRLSGGRIQGLKYHNWYLILGLILLTVQYAMKLLIPGYQM